MYPIVKRNNSVSRWRDPLDDVRRELGRLFDAHDDDSQALMPGYPVDIHEDDEAYTIEAELPGFTKDDINIELHDNVLTISAQREPQNAHGRPHLQERRFTRVQRRFALPAGVKDTGAEAQFTDGVLNLRLPKREDMKPKQIKVK